MANALRAGVVWANTFNKFDPTSPFGGYKESGYGREGGRHGLEGYLQSERRASTSARPTSSTSAASSRARSRATPTSSTTPRAGSSPTPRWPRARTPATRSSRPARRSRGWSGRTAYNRGQVLYRVAEVMEDRRPQFVEAVRQGEGGTPPRPARSSTPRSTGSSGTPAGPTRSPRSSATPTRSPGRSSTSRRPSRPASSPCSRPQESSLLGLVSVVAPVIVTGNTVVVASSADRPLPAVTFAEVLATSDVPGGVVNILTGSLADTAADAGLAHGRQRDRPDRPRRRRRAGDRRSRSRPPRTSSGYAVRRPPSPTGPPTRASTG